MYRKTVGLDGETYDSHAESVVANWLLENFIEYEPHKKLPSPSRQICDFYLPDYDLYIEYDGLMDVRRGNKLQKKYKFYKDHNLNFIIVDRNNWQTKLYERIMCS